VSADGGRSLFFRYRRPESEGTVRTMSLSVKTKIVLFVLHSLIFVSSVVSYYGFKGGRDSLHYLMIHSGNINLQVKNEGYHRYEKYYPVRPQSSVELFVTDLKHVFCFRILHTTVTADYETSNREDCALTLRYDFPSDIYVDKYELANIALSRKVCTICVHYIFSTLD